MATWLPSQGFYPAMQVCIDEPDYFSFAVLAGEQLEVWLDYDPAEADLPFSGHVRFEGLEGEDEQSVGKADSLRLPYAHRLQARQSALAELAGRLGWTFLIHHTDKPAQSALLSIHQALADRPAVHF